MPSTKVKEETKDRIDQIALATKMKPEDITEQAINDLWVKKLPQIRAHLQKADFTSALFSDVPENSETTELQEGGIAGSGAGEIEAR